MTVAWRSTQSTTPWVTYGLLAANITLWAAMTIAFHGADPVATALEGPNAVQLLTIGASDPTRTVLAHEYWRLITACFLHGGLMHLAFNSWAISIYGPGLERAFGPARFLFLYLLCGLGGSIASVMLSHSVSVGASGAIFGLVGIYWSLLIRRRAPAEAIRPIVWIVGLNFAMGLRPGSHIDNWAHAGGLLTGLALGRLVPDPATHPARHGIVNAAAWACSFALLGYGVAGVGIHLVAAGEALVPAHVESWSVSVPAGWELDHNDHSAGVWADPEHPDAYLVAAQLDPTGSGDDASRTLTVTREFARSLSRNSLPLDMKLRRLSLPGRVVYRVRSVVHQSEGEEAWLVAYRIAYGARSFFVALVQPIDVKDRTPLAERIAESVRPG